MEFEWNFARNCAKNGFFFQNNSVGNSLICPRTSQQTTVPLNYSQSIQIFIGPSDGGTIISSSRCPTVLYQRLTEL